MDDLEGILDWEDEEIEVPLELGACSHCNGSGYVWLHFSDDELNREPGEEWEETCHVCGGSGLEVDAEEEEW